MVNLTNEAEELSFNSNLLISFRGSRLWAKTRSVFTPRGIDGLSGEQRLCPATSKKKIVVAEPDFL